MADKNTTLAKHSYPGPWKQFLDTAVVPVAIDASAAVEAGLERIAVGTRRSPLAGVGAAFGAGCASALWLRRFALAAR